MNGRKPGRKVDKVGAEVKRLRSENERLHERLATAEELVAAQGKAFALLQKMSRKSAGES